MLPGKRPGGHIFCSSCEEGIVFWEVSGCVLEEDNYVLVVVWFGLEDYMDFTLGYFFFFVPYFRMKLGRKGCLILAQTLSTTACSEAERTQERERMCALLPESVDWLTRAFLVIGILVCSLMLGYMIFHLHQRSQWLERAACWVDS